MLMGMCEKLNVNSFKKSKLRQYMVKIKKSECLKFQIYCRN